MASLLLPVGYQISDKNGRSISGAKVFVYDAGTTDAANTFSNIDLSNALTQPTQPIVADSSGRVPNIYIASGQNYKIKIANSADVDIFTRDDIPPYVSDASATLPIASGGTGATTVAAARTALNAASKSTVDALSDTVSDMEAQFTGIGGDLGAMAARGDVVATDFGAGLVAVLQFSNSGIQNSTMANTEGTEALTQTFTPKRSDSIIRLTASVETVGIKAVKVGVFVSGNAASINSKSAEHEHDTDEHSMMFPAHLFLGSTDEVTFSIRSTAPTNSNAYLQITEMLTGPIS